MRPPSGMDIEAVARDSPEDILTVPIDILKGATRQQCVDLAVKLGFTDDLIDKVGPHGKEYTFPQSV